MAHACDRQPSSTPLDCGDSPTGTRLYPLHVVIFRGMLSRIVDFAEQLPAGESSTPAAVG